MKNLAGVNKAMKGIEGFYLEDELHKYFEAKEAQLLRPA